MLTGSEGPMLARLTEVLLNKQAYILQHRLRPIIQLTDKATIHDRNYNRGTHKSLTAKAVAIYDNNDKNALQMATVLQDYFYLLRCFELTFSNLPLLREVNVLTKSQVTRGLLCDFSAYAWYVRRVDLDVMTL